MISPGVEAGKCCCNERFGAAFERTKINVYRLTDMSDRFITNLTAARSFMIGFTFIFPLKTSVLFILNDKFFFRITDLLHVNQPIPFRIAVT